MSQLPLGQLIAFGFDGYDLDNDAKNLLAKEKACGVVLFKRNISSLEQVIELNSAIIGACSHEMPALISVDQEGGRVQRLRDICTSIPPMRTIGKLTEQDSTLPYRLGAMMARELSALGFNLDFTPVVDVDTNPQNPVIGERSFSRDAQEVATMGAALIRGMQGAGIAACAKHFPGHGDTDIDSHLALPAIHHDRQRIEQVELKPFYAAIAANVASIMTAHMSVPAFDDHLPATLSHPILTGLLREKMGFSGVIFSDDINMRAMSDHYDMREILLQGLYAGVDVFLICQDTQKSLLAIETLKQLVQDGEIGLPIIHAALARIAALKKRYIGAVAQPDLDYAKSIVACEPHMNLAKTWQDSQASSARPISAVDIS